MSIPNNAPVNKKNVKSIVGTNLNPFLIILFSINLNSNLLF